MNKPFVLNSHARIVFPFNFLPDLDFTVFDTLEQFSAVIRRDFEEKAPTETDIVARLRDGKFASRYELLRDLGLDLFWVNRYALTMYEKRPMRVFAPGFGAGAVGGYVVMRVDPAVVA